ncbi:MAG TPA: cytochrome c-type biogenesis protein [Steroidobacteraceae bacterium]|nr:cytochrome c-type biogenesis protein [Steroidobacteraceae bacterium]
MRRAGIAVLLALAALPLLAIDAAPPLPDPVQQQRYQALIHELRCLKCQGETVADTQAMFGEDIRRQVREMVQSGKSDGEVREYLVDRYGEIILLRPRWSAGNAWLWLAPAVFLLGGFWVGWRILRQRRVLLATDTSEVDEVRRT